MEAQTEFQSLQNFASTLNLTVHKFYPEDCRKKVQYFLCKDSVSISPKLDFMGLQHFMLGYMASNKQLKNQLNSVIKSISHEINTK